MCLGDVGDLGQSSFRRGMEMEGRMGCTPSGGEIWMGRSPEGKSSFQAPSRRAGAGWVGGESCEVFLFCFCLRCSMVFLFV